MPKFYFQNPSFNQGLNVSVRRGVKWNTEAQKGVMLVDTANPDKEIGTVDIETRVFRFCDLIDADIAAEHDANCRTVAGLLEVMKKIYPSFDSRELVTLVYFQK